MDNRPAPRRRKLTPAQMAERRRRKIKGWLSIFAILIVVGGLIAMICHLLSQMHKVTELQVDTAEYKQLSELPTMGEQVEKQRKEELERLDKLFEERDEYPVTEEIRTPYCVMYDVEAEELLYAKNANEKAFPASTTKIMTAALVAEYAPSTTVFTAGDEQFMIEEGSSLAYIEDAQLSRENIIDAIMIPSGNDASYCAAAVTGRIIAGDEELSARDAVQVFVDKMNETAKEIRCTGTNFTCPDGFHDDDHYTTAMDMLKITYYSMKYPEIAAAGKMTYSDEEFISGETAEWENSNRLLDEDSDYYYTYATGLKTGMTDMSGYCVVATARRFEHTIILVMLGSETSELRWNESICLFDRAFLYVRDRPEKSDDEDDSEEDTSDSEEDDTDSGDNGDSDDE